MVRRMAFIRVGHGCACKSFLWDACSGATRSQVRHAILNKACSAEEAIHER